MWVGLLVVAPVVLAAALSVRRPEAAFSRVPDAWFAEAPVSTEVVPTTVGLPVRIEWYLGRTGSGILADSSRLQWLRAGDSGPWTLAVDRMAGFPSSPLLYWKRGTAGDRDALMAANHEEDGLTSLQLPGDATLLGLWPAASASRFTAPDVLATQGGLLFLFDLHAGVVVGLSWIAPAPEGSPR